MLEKQLNECLPMCAWQSAIKELRAQQSNGGRGEKTMPGGSWITEPEAFMSVKRPRLEIRSDDEEDQGGQH